MKRVFLFLIVVFAATMLMADDSKNQYKDNGNGTVTETTRGLIWQKKHSDVKMNWAKATDYCKSLDLAGLTWQLPELKDQLSLRADQSKQTPKINTQFFPDTPSDWFWTSSPRKRFNNMAWAANFGEMPSGQGHFSAKYKHVEYYVRCVSVSK